MLLWEKMIFRLRYRIAPAFRGKTLKQMKERLINHDFSLISSNCCGGILSHDLGLKFNSPTVNLYFSAPDFVLFCEGLEKNLKKEPVFLETAAEGYPICAIDDIRIHAMHYTSYEDFLICWQRRAKRVRLDNTFIMMTDRDGFTDSLLPRIAKLPYPKVVYAHEKHDEYPFVCYMKEYSQKDQVGDIYKYADVFGNRYYENCCRLLYRSTIWSFIWRNVLNPSSIKLIKTLKSYW